MSSRTPAEDENSTAHTPHDVMLSASEASAFQFREKADSSASPQNDIQGPPCGRTHFSTEFTKFKSSNTRTFVGFVVNAYSTLDLATPRVVFCRDALTIEVGFTSKEASMNNLR